jgi:tetratricopeptide (TPR) repeat protein
LAIELYRNASILFYETNNWKKYLKCQLQISQSYQIKGLFDSSFYYLIVSDKFIKAKKITDKKLLGEYCYLKATTFSKRGDLDSSLFYLNKAFEFCTGGLNDSLQVLVNRSLGNINYSKGEYNAALELYNKALETEQKRNNSSETMIAALFQNLGIIYSTQGKYDTAKLYLNQSIVLKEKILKQNDPQLAIGYLNYGRFLNILGYPDEALIYLSKAEEIYKFNFGFDYFGLAPIYFNKGSIFIILRDLNKALTYHERALELYENQTSSKNPIISDIYMNIGVIYEKMGEFTKAINYYKESLKENYNSESVVKAYRNLARCYYNLNDFLQAEDNHKLSIEKSEFFFGVNHYLTAASYQAYGNYCISTGKYKRAEELLNKAYDIWVKNFGSKHREVSLVLTGLGDLYRKMNDYDQALIFYQKAIIAYTTFFNDENIHNNPSLNDLDPEFNNFTTLYKKAYTLYDNFLEKSKSFRDLEVGYKTGILAINLFESILSTYKDENTKMLMNEYVYDIYNLIVLMASDLYEKTDNPEYLNTAFEYSEKGKAAVLLSSVRQLEAIEIGNIPNDVRNREKSLNREISLFKNLLYDESQKISPDSNKMISWKKNIFEKTLSYDSLIGSIEKNYPQYFNLKYNFDVIKIGDVQKNLRDGEVFIEYKIVDSVLFVFFITRDSINFNKEILDSDFSVKVYNFISSINQFPGGSVNKESYIEFIYIGNYLYRTLLGFIGQSKEYEDIIIVPDNILGYLTFEALIKEFYVPDKIDFKNLDYVIKSHSVSYSYSGTLLYKHLFKNKGRGTLLAMAPTYSTSDTISADAFYGSRDISKYLNPLKYSIEEVNKIAGVIKGKVLTGEDATEKNFKAIAENYNILHFAMHTLINDEDPLASKLVFSLNNDTVDDGFLNVYEIYNLKLNAELAVLSACKTGAGKLSKGEGIMSLARGFLYAGVPSIVMTLWEIEDISGAEIMVEFYRNLNDGLISDEALRNSKLAYLESANQLQSHPYFWAAYVQIGDNSKVITYSYAKYFVYPGALLILITLIYFIKKYIKKRKVRIFN